MTLIEILWPVLPRPHRRAYADRKARELATLADAMDKARIGGRVKPSASDVRAQAMKWARRAER